MHQCPGPDCDKRVEYGKLACLRHWYQVPADIRRLIWRTWKDGRGAGTPEHADAVVEACSHMRA